MTSRKPNPPKHAPLTRSTGAPPSRDIESPEKLLKITGYPAVAALFQVAPERIVRFFYEDRMVPKIGTFCAFMASRHRPYRMLDAEELARVAGTVRHGGIIAIAEPRPLLPFSADEAKFWVASKQALFVLDGIGNTHNLGAIARTLAFFGYDKLVLSDHPLQAGLSDSAYRVAEGGLEYLNLYKAARLPALLHKLQSSYRIVGTSLEHGMPLENLPPDPRPPLVILGNEEHGLAPTTLRASEVVVRLKGKGSVQSLNVSATAAILAYTLKSPPTPPPQAARSPSRAAKPTLSRKPRPAGERKR